MSVDLPRVLTLVATASSGVLAGASLDQSIKQLPARHKLGPVGFARYSQAADLSNGVLWYASAGVGAASLTIAAAIVGWVNRLPSPRRELLAAAAAGAVLHSLTTLKAAPINFSQRAAAHDAARLANIFNRFERWQSIRCAFQVLTFLVLLASTVPA